MKKTKNGSEAKQQRGLPGMSADLRREEAHDQILKFFLKSGSEASPEETPRGAVPKSLATLEGQQQGLPDGAKDAVPNSLATLERQQIKLPSYVHC